MKRSLQLILFILICQSSFAVGSMVVTDSTKLSLLTCSPGPLAYEKFGHTAIRICDDSQGIDFVANWGLINFNEPCFYYKFVKGETYYELGFANTNFFLESYHERNSSVTEQILMLTTQEKTKLINLIFENYQPENRKYLYNFVFDNCATRPQVFILGLFDKDKINFNMPAEAHTFRQWVAMYTGEKSWLMFGIDLVFGRDADRNATRWESMFLPEVLLKELGGVTVSDDESGCRVLMSGAHEIVKSFAGKKAEKNFLQPLNLSFAILLLVLILTFIELKYKKKFKIIDALLLFITGLSGIIIFYLMIISIQPLVKMNFNILWCNPFNIIAAVLIFLPRCSKIIHVYQIVSLLLMSAAIIAAIMDLQVFNIAFFPLIVMLQIRALAWLQFDVQRKKYYKTR